MARPQFRHVKAILEAIVCLEALQPLEVAEGEQLMGPGKVLML